MKKRKKTRNAANYRAASLKGHRVRERMKLARGMEYQTLAKGFAEYLRPSEVARRTIDLIPKVEWS